MTAVGIDDDFSTSQTGITVRAANHETSGRVNVELGFAVNPMGRDRLGTPAGQ